MLDEDRDEKINNISLFFTESEIQELLCDLQQLLSHKKNSHIHMSSHDYQKEITICKYESSKFNRLAQ